MSASFSDSGYKTKQLHHVTKKEAKIITAVLVVALGLLWTFAKP